MGDGVAGDGGGNEDGGGGGWFSEWAEERAKEDGWLRDEERTPLVYCDMLRP